MIKLDDKFTIRYSPHEQLVMLRLIVGADLRRKVKSNTPWMYEVVPTREKEYKTLKHNKTMTIFELQKRL